MNNKIVQERMHMTLVRCLVSIIIRSLFVTISMINHVKHVQSEEEAVVAKLQPP